MLCCSIWCSALMIGSKLFVYFAYKFKTWDLEDDPFSGSNTANGIEAKDCIRISISSLNSYKASI